MNFFFSFFFLFISLKGIDSIEGHNPNITKVWQPSTTECIKSNNKLSSSSISSIYSGSSSSGSSSSSSSTSSRSSNSNNNDEGQQGRTSGRIDLNRSINDDADDDDDDNDVGDDDSSNIIEGAAPRSKVSRSSATETMGLSGSSGLSSPMQVVSFATYLFYSSVTWFTLNLIL